VLRGRVAMLVVSDALKVVVGKHGKYFDAKVIETKGPDGKMLTHKFVKFGKTNEWKQIMFPDNTERSPFMKTSLLERLVAERDEEFRRQVGAKQGPNGKYCVWRYTKDNQAKALLVEDTIHDVKFDSIADVQGDKVPVLLTKPGSPLWVCSGALGYMKGALSAEHANGQVLRVKPLHPDDDINIEGANKLVTARGNFLRVRCAAADGRPRKRMMKMTDDVMAMEEKVQRLRTCQDSGVEETDMDEDGLEEVQDCENEEGSADEPVQAQQDVE
jgi:hypothetical protein